jgi:hypothetical protein
MDGLPQSNFGETGAAAEYDARVRRMNPGYEFAFELVSAVLLATCAGDAHLLLVGGGGSTEVAAYGAANRNWTIFRPVRASTPQRSATC